MNTDEFKALVDLSITNAIDDDSITPAIVGARLKELLDVAKPYKCLLIRVTIDGGGVTAVELINDFGAGNVTYDNPSTGLLRATFAGTPLTVNTILITRVVQQGTTPYRVVSTFSTSQFNMNLQQWDGTQTSTPFITNQLFEIRVYNV